MKIVLAALNAKYVHSNLAVYDLEAYSKCKLEKELRSEIKPDISVREYTINHNLEQIMQSLYKEEASLLAFSCYIWNISEILNICREIKKVSPKLLIWLGGPEVSYDSEKVLKNNSFIDGVIVGEGEETFYELIKMYCELEAVLDKEEQSKEENSKEDHNKEVYDKKQYPDNSCVEDISNNIGLNDYEKEFAKGKERYLSNIPGITYRASDGRIVKNLPRPLLSLDEIPFIYEDLSRFENKILYYESSRGCPFSCSYCLSSIDKSVRFRSLDKVFDELSFFMSNKVRQVKFIDRTFNCDKNRAREIWRYLKDNDNGITNYHFEIAADLIEDEDISIFSKMRPGLIQLEIGLQTTNLRTIKEIRRTMDIEKLKNNMNTIRRMRNIHQHLDLIAGLPYEDYESFVRSFNDAYELKPDQLQLGFLKVLKGSYMEEQVKEYNLIYSDEQPYEVLSTKWISYGEILKLKRVEEMVELYYNSAMFEHVLLYMESFFDTPFEMYESMGKYYEDNGFVDIGLRREDKYAALRAFFKERFEDAIKIFDSLLTFDYYLRENAKTRPKWRKDSMIEKADYNNFFKSGGTDELYLAKEGYDSKAAARSMHIEPIIAESASWITGKDYSDVKTEWLYAVFDYNSRDPLTKAADYNIITHL